LNTYILKLVSVWASVRLQRETTSSRDGFGRTCWTSTATRNPIASPTRNSKLAHPWNVPKPGSDEDLNLGVSALRAFIERFPHTQAGQPGAFGDCRELRCAQALCRRRGRIETISGRLPLPGPRRDSFGPIHAGPLLPVAEEVRRGDRGVARLSGQASVGQAVERRAA